MTNAAEDPAIHIYDFTIKQASAQLKATAKVISKGKIFVLHGPLTTEVLCRPSELRSVLKNVLESHIEAGDTAVCHDKEVNSPWPKRHKHGASGIVFSKIRESGTI